MLKGVKKIIHLQKCFQVADPNPTINANWLITKKSGYA